MAYYPYDFFKKNMQTTLDFAVSPLKVRISSYSGVMKAVAFLTALCLAAITISLGLIAAALQTILLPFHALYQEAENSITSYSMS